MFYCITFFFSSLTANTSDIYFWVFFPFYCFSRHSSMHLFLKTLNWQLAVHKERVIVSLLCSRLPQMPNGCSKCLFLSFSKEVSANDRLTSPWLVVWKPERERGRNWKRGSLEADRRESKPSSICCWGKWTGERPDRLDSSRESLIKAKSAWLN